MSSAKITQLQLLQQNLQNVISQKQQMDGQLVELDSALSELKTTNQAYKIVGKLMIAAPKETLISELGQQKEIVEVRIKNFTKQQEKLKSQIDETQQEVVSELAVDKALIALAELNSIDLSSYHRTRVWDIISLLESVNTN